MTPFLGSLLLHMGLATTAAGLVAGLAAGRARSAAAAELARQLAYVTAILFTGATVLMVAALVAHDFSVAYVAQVGSRATPPVISAVSLWSSLDGSLLFWTFVLAAMTGVFAALTRRSAHDLTGWSLASLFGTQLFFAGILVVLGQPFAEVSPLPADGPGPNPLLQNHILMVFHPPTLYVGYVGMAIPFAMAVAALAAGRLEPAWLRSLRNHALVVWAFLTLGIVLGGWWSYEVLGWGGYWAWDPVENASLLPWLTLTAFFHSVSATERRGHFTGWSLGLIMGSFLLTLLGTFMTRSGVFNSVHSFTQSAIGPVFLVFIALVLLGVVVLMASRLGVVEGRAAGGFGVVSREGSLLLNNLVFTVFAFTVLLGTLYPLVNQAITGDQVSVGEPYYDKMTRPLAMALLFLMALGPLLGWGRARWKTVRRRMLVPLVLGHLAGIVAAIFTDGGWFPLTVMLATVAGAVSAGELASTLGSRRGGGPVGGLVRTVSLHRRRVGAHVAHLGVVLMAFSIGASGMVEDVELTFSTEESATWHGYTLTFLGEEVADEEFRVVQRAWFGVKSGARDLGRLAPSMNHYERMSQPLGTPAVRMGLLEDLYLSLLRVDRGTGRATVKVYREPLVVWIWLGGALMVLGALGAAWPRRPGRARPVEAR